MVPADKTKERTDGPGRENKLENRVSWISSLIDDRQTEETDKWAAETLEHISAGFQAFLIQVNLLET